MPTTGPIIIDLLGCDVTEEERDLLQQPLVGGVLFFTRNFDSPSQMTDLCRQIRSIQKQPLVLTVDQEGGRVQRFQNGFTRLPSMGWLGEQAEHAPTLAHAVGWLMAAELLDCGIDLSFAPVLDLNKKRSTVIGDRAFHRDPDTVITLASAFIRGMREAGMAAVGKHFPGHGSVEADSHHTLPTDLRSFAEIAEDDLKPFRALNQLEGVMAAHLLFPAIDNEPVGFSSYWLQTVLRQQLQFRGCVFSDALDMQGAAQAGSFPNRVKKALEAGADTALLCNSREGLIETLDTLPSDYRPVAAEKYQPLLAKKQGRLTHSPQWHHFNSLTRKQCKL